MITIRRLRWDPGNVAHIARHGLSIEDVETACHSEPLVQQGSGGRLLVFGPARDGRLLTIVLEPETEAGTYDVIRARRASRRERTVCHLKRTEGE